MIVINTSKNLINAFLLRRRCHRHHFASVLFVCVAFSPARHLPWHKHTQPNRMNEKKNERTKRQSVRSTIPSSSLRFMRLFALGEWMEMRQKANICFAMNCICWMCNWCYTSNFPTILKPDTIHSSAPKGTIHLAFVYGVCVCMHNAVVQPKKLVLNA